MRQTITRHFWSGLSHCLSSLVTFSSELVPLGIFYEDDILFSYSLNILCQYLVLYQLEAGHRNSLSCFFKGVRAVQSSLCGFYGLASQMAAAKLKDYFFLSFQLSLSLSLSMYKFIINIYVYK